MKLIHPFATSLAVTAIFIAAMTACGGGRMDMPPPASGATPTSTQSPSAVDPNLHVTLPAASGSAAQPAQNGSMAGMPGMSPAAPAASSAPTGAMKPAGTMPGMSKPAGGKPGGMKMGCCGDAPMPKSSSSPTPPAPMPMKPEHGDGHM